MQTLERQIDIGTLNRFSSERLQKEKAKPAEGFTDQIDVDLWEHSLLQGQFDGALGRIYSSKDMLTRSYNPVTDILHMNKRRRENDQAGEKAYRKEMKRNIETNLKERLQVSENVIHYRIEGEEIYSEDFPTEPFSNVLRRGAEYRLKHGTPEPEREGWLGEQAGWEIIRKKFTDPKTEVGTKMSVLSPPGMVKDSAYDRTIADEYELVEENGKKSMKLTRRIVDFEESDYLRTAISINPQYFDNFDGRPLDAWYLSHPFEGFFPNLPIAGMSSAMFDKIYSSPLLQGIITHYTEHVSAENVDWRQLAMDINAIYNQVDKEEKAALEGTESEQNVYISREVINETVQQLGLIQPDEKGGVGCPTSKGYSIFSNSMAFSSWNSVSAYSSAPGEAACQEIKCPCGWKANESEASSIQEGNLTACPRCGWSPGGGGSSPKHEEFELAA